MTKTIMTKQKSRMKNNRVWPVGIIMAMAVFVAIMLAVVTVSFQHRPQLVTENYYAEGFNLRQWKDHAAASAATGWQVQVRPLPLDLSIAPLVQLLISDAGGKTCDSLSGNVTFYRPSDQSLDLATTSLQAVGGGKYLAKLPRPLEYGSWQAVTHLEHGSQQMDTRVSFFVEK